MSSSFFSNIFGQRPGPDEPSASVLAEWNKYSGDTPCALCTPYKSSWCHDTCICTQTTLSATHRRSHLPSKTRSFISLRSSCQPHGGRRGNSADIYDRGIGKAQHRCSRGGPDCRCRSSNVGLEFLIILLMQSSDFRRPHVVTGSFSWV